MSEGKNLPPNGYQWAVAGNHHIGTMSKITAINILLAVVALLKDMFLASYLGTTENSDALLLAFFITDLVSCNLLSNAVSAGCISLFSKNYVQNGNRLNSSYVKRINGYMIFVSCLILLAILLFREPLINLIGMGYAEETKQITVKLLLVMLPSIIIYPAVSIGISELQVKGKFIEAAFTPVLFNLIFLIGTTICMIRSLPSAEGIYIIAWSIVLSILAMLLWTYFFLSNGEKNDDRKTDMTSKQSILEYNRLVIPYMAILFLSQGILLVERYLASGYGTGSVSALNYAYRLSQFPIWVFVAAIGTVAFPSMAKAHGSGKLDITLDTWKHSIWLMLMVTIPVSLFLFILREPVISVLFQRQEFDSQSLQMTSTILTSYTFAILGQSITMLCLKYYLAIGRIKEPMIIFMITGAMNIMIDFYLIDKIGLIAFGYGAATAGTLNAYLLIKNLKLGRATGKISKVLKLLEANAAAAASGICLVYIWDLRVSHQGFLFRFLFLGVTFVIYAAIYYLAVKRLKIADI